MAISKELKKQVITDWGNAFPELTVYAQDKLYRVVGPVVIGLELVKLPRTDEYRPHFVVYPLWRKDIKESLSTPIVLMEYYDRRGFQFNIPYGLHSTSFNEALDSVRKQTLLPFKGIVSLKKIVSVLDDYSKKPPLIASPNSYLQAALQEAKLKIALFISATDAQTILEQIGNRNWDTNHFNACGVDVDKWLRSLHTTISNRNDFLKQIEKNKQGKKMSNLESSDFMK